MDGAGDVGAREGSDGQGAIAAGDDAGFVGLAAQVEIVGGRGEADTTPGPQGVEGNLDQAGGIAIKDPERVTASRQPHREGVIAGLDAPGDRKQRRVELVHGPVLESKGVRLSGFRAGQNLRGGGVERNLSASLEAREVHRGDGAAAAISDKAIAKEALGLRTGAPNGGSGGGYEQRSPRNQGRGHYPLFYAWPGRRITG